MAKNIPSSWTLYALMLGRRGYRRGGRNLSERPSHPGRTMPRSQPSSSSSSSPSSSSWVDEKVSKLSSPALTSPSTVSAAARISRDGEEHISFHGVKIPKKPLPPAADGIMSGCAVCIYDLYLESKQAYRTTLASALAKLEQMHVPRDTWPEEVRALRSSPPAASVPSGSGSGSGSGAGGPSLHDGLPVDEEDLAMTASMGAFLELEKRLGRSSPSAAPSSPPPVSTSSNFMP
ncbi:hypothetical protein BS47DRAFT_1346080 [Hydnum rufescens UP504]|uniref:Oxidoreductase-like domain-containing protein n=1 Tax=Hydnum rufescens UP504 TaxID=1448309 RepID=A0A9P6AUH8_9AGAM|nr:hypothetical protein BS47DRAFT_1346080 [Hydnum rufescens UP504]